MLIKACCFFYLDQQNTDDVPVVLYVYEFDAKANLNYDDVECLLDQISKLPNTDGKTFETIAGMEIISNILTLVTRFNVRSSKDKQYYYNLMLAIFQHSQLNFPTHQEIFKSQRMLWY